MIEGKSANLAVDKAHIGPFAALYADFTDVLYVGRRHEGYLKNDLFSQRRTRGYGLEVLL